MIKHRITALIAVLAVIFISFPYGDQAYAGGKTQTAQSYMQATERGPAHLRHEALNWACAQKGKYIDADGAYGAQCVDLIYAYYEYLGVGRRGGNGADYQYDDKLPAGWVRLYAKDGAVPMPGDVVVWGGHTYDIHSSDGHVGIIHSVDRNGSFKTIEQNYSGDRSVSVNKRKAGHFTCVLRPNWDTSLSSYLTHLYKIVYLSSVGSQEQKRRAS